MKFVNQLDYPHLMYKIGSKRDYDYYLANKERIDACKFDHINFQPGMKPVESIATVERAGCGLCCAVMVADRLTPNSKFTLEDAIELSYASHANEGIGTEFDPFAPAFAEKMNYEYKGSNDLDELDQWLAAGGAAVVKVAGDRRDGHIGVFSNGWHYITALYKRPDGRYALLDPYLYDGKYDEDGKQGLVEVDGVLLYTNAEVLLEESKLFDPRFYMFRLK
ncbi:MAG: hypothetical protein IKE36_10965 [Solobacterium sp.]|nr:hypothetical protein [Solobacterium sp.]